MASNDLDVLIIRHIADIEDASRRLDVLNEKVGAAIDSLGGKLASEEGWAGKFEDDNWTAPLEWAVDVENDEYVGWFWWGYREGAAGPNGEGDANWLTSVCAAGYQELGLRFEQEALTGKRALREFWRQHFDEVSEYGIVLDDRPGLFLPVHIDREELAAAIADGNIEAGLEPLRTAFETLVRARPAFDKIIAALKEAAAK